MRTTKFGAAVVGAIALAGCGVEAPPEQQSQPFTSQESTLLTFEFEGQLITSQANAKYPIERQLYYTIGQLNGDRSVGRLDRLELTDLREIEIDGERGVSYHAKLPVAWGQRDRVPSSYELLLPKAVDSSWLNAFVDEHWASCVEGGAHDVTADSFWYYYRPNNGRCALGEPGHADVFRIPVRVSVSDENTEGKYPEYHEIWKDDLLEVVAIFGKNEDYATASHDAGISAYNQFLAAVPMMFDVAVETVPEVIPSRPGVEIPEAVFRGTLNDGRRFQIVALLVDNVRNGGLAFEERYRELSGTADLIAYGGHAGLGSNVRALTRMGEFQPGKYQIIFMNGCDTFAYVDGYLAEARAKLNPDDPTGTRYMDIVTNAMPAYFSYMSGSVINMLRGLLAYDAPMTYQQIFQQISSSQVVLVTGEEDNVFAP